MNKLKYQRISLTDATSQERWQLLKIYVKNVLVDIVTFVVFVGAVVMAALISGGIGKFRILVKIAGRQISAVGVICGINLVARNENDFKRLLLMKGPLQPTCVPRIHDERRTI